MKSLRTMGLAVAAIALLAPTYAHATGYEQGWYLGADALMNFQNEGDATLSGVTNSAEYGDGWGLSGSVGYGWGFGLRTEGELVYRHASIDTVTGAGSAAVDGGGIHNLALMANALYDIDLGTRLTPYIGAGVGVSFVDGDDMYSVNGQSIEDSRAALAYQGIVGFSLELDGNWAFTADYRYFATPDVKLDTSAAGVKAEVENSSHNLLMGIRYTFAAPKAAPVPAPVPVKAAPAPVPMAPKSAAPYVAPVPQSYIVFFDWDRAVLTPEAKRIIASAAEDFKRGGTVRIVVTGHADTSGKPGYNQKLSERRADAVKREFAALGVSAQSLVAAGAGETTLRVPTADGVREAQNRRAEIVFK